MLPGEVTRAEWHQSFSLDEIYKFKTPTAKTIPALNNNLKFFLSATLFCPNINSHIKQMTDEYQNCTQHRNQLPAETQLKHKIPVTPWTKVATDIFHLNNMSYVIIIDYTIRFFNVQLLKKSIDNSDKKMKHTFAIFGMPQILISDNGPEYKSEKFIQFAKDFDFKHITTSLNYPEANRLVERNIQAIKKKHS